MVWRLIERCHLNLCPYVWWWMDHFWLRLLARLHLVFSLLFHLVLLIVQTGIRIEIAFISRHLVAQGVCINAFILKMVSALQIIAILHKSMQPTDETLPVVVSIVFHDWLAPLVQDEFYVGVQVIQ